MNDRGPPETSADANDRRTGPPPTEQLFAVLSNPRRRAILRSLGPPERRTRTLEELVDDVVTRRFESEPAGDVPDRENVAASLYHVHLPKLRNAGLVVRSDDGFESADYRLVGEILDDVEAHEDDR